MLASVPAWADPPPASVIMAYGCEGPDNLYYSASAFGDEYQRNMAMLDDWAMPYFWIETAHPEVAGVWSDWRPLCRAYDEHLSTYNIDCEGSAPERWSWQGIIFSSPQIVIGGPYIDFSWPGLTEIPIQAALGRLNVPRNGPPVGNIIVSAPIRFMRLGNCLPAFTGELVNFYRDTGQDINIVNKPVLLGVDTLAVDTIDLGISIDPNARLDLGEAAEAVDIQIGEFSEDVQEAYGEPDPGSFIGEDATEGVASFGASADDFLSRVGQTSFLAYLGTVHLPSSDGPCPVLEFDAYLLGTLRLDAHCEIAESISEPWGVVMWISWLIVSIRILGSA